MKRVLVVDDDEVQLSHLKKALEENNYEVVIASHGREAKRIFQENPADLLITDIFMPEMDGYELIREIRISFPKAKIIAISDESLFAGMSLTDTLNTAETLGADASIQKPIELSHLYAVIEELLIH